MKNNNTIINARKYDGKLHRSWNADLISQNDSLLIFVGEFENEVKHPELGLIARGTISYEYYWLDRWYNIFRFHEPNGDLRNYYCNINMPPTFEDNILNYVDLDVDILVSKDFAYDILDEDEFCENAKTYSYTNEIKQKVKVTLEVLKELIKTRGFPFSVNRTNLTFNRDKIY